MAPLATPSNLPQAAVMEISAALTAALADIFTLYFKTKNFHWHVSGPNFRDYHLMFDEHASELFMATDPVAERVRKLGGSTIRSIGDIARRQRLLDNDVPFMTPKDMLAELRDDNKQLASILREVHATCDEHGDYATVSLLESLIEEAESRTWYLFELTRDTD
jgi:starvation-inducible DNA-binding protein